MYIYTYLTENGVDIIKCTFVGGLRETRNSSRKYKVRNKTISVVVTVINFPFLCTHNIIHLMIERLLLSSHI